MIGNRRSKSGWEQGSNADEQNLEKHRGRGRKLILVSVGG